MEAQREHLLYIAKVYLTKAKPWLYESRVSSRQQTCQKPSHECPSQKGWLHLYAEGVSDRTAGLLPVLKSVYGTIYIFYDNKIKKKKL